MKWVFRVDKLNNNKWKIIGEFNSFEEAKEQTKNEPEKYRIVEIRIRLLWLGSAIGFYSKGRNER